MDVMKELGGLFPYFAGYDTPLRVSSVRIFITTNCHLRSDGQSYNLINAT